MTGGQASEHARSFLVSNDIFHQPELDIYSQMTYIVLKSCSSEAHLPEVSDIARLGRMNVKQVLRGLQTLVEVKLLTNKIYRQMIGDFQDDRLSWAAKGLLAFCKENPNGNIDELLELSSESGEDEHSIRRALKELGQYGYLEEYPEWSKIASPV
ncbi:hypothetical protein [Paenibacillus contaminans]|uniref:Uncharacterized protein n=1 Tax=Paenibacillus contaminans TaxID=450362 RepID=A0A329MN63_9BACL|nr:hypothetical protein [Paenibacillus contaminans]RAV19347.1 hypothetical protein DQG23_20325 [Paenibacillus contaminans]